MAKNQLNMKKETNYDTLIKFIVYLLNISYENSFFQQVMNIISNDEKLLGIFINELFNRLYQGRNVKIKLQDMKFMFKFILTSKYISYDDMVKKLFQFTKSKNNGGARTSHQIILALNSVNYCLDVMQSKLITFDENELNSISSFALSCFNDYSISSQDKEEQKKRKNILNEMKKILYKIISKNEDLKKIVDQFFSKVLPQNNNVNNNKNNADNVKEDSNKRNNSSERKNSAQKSEGNNSSQSTEKKIVQKKNEVIENANKKNNNQKYERKKSEQKTEKKKGNK